MPFDSCLFRGIDKLYEMKNCFVRSRFWISFHLWIKECFLQEQGQQALPARPWVWMLAPCPESPAYGLGNLLRNAICVSDILMHFFLHFEKFPRVKVVWQSCSLLKLVEPVVPLSCWDTKALSEECNTHNADKLFMVWNGLKSRPSRKSLDRMLAFCEFLIRQIKFICLAPIFQASVCSLWAAVGRSVLVGCSLYAQPYILHFSVFLKNTIDRKDTKSQLLSISPISKECWLILLLYIFYYTSMPWCLARIFSCISYKIYSKY